MGFFERPSILVVHLPLLYIESFIPICSFCFCSVSPVQVPSIPCPASCPHLCLQQVWASSQERGIPWILLLLQTNPGFCLSRGRVGAPVTWFTDSCPALHLSCLWCPFCLCAHLSWWVPPSLMNLAPGQQRVGLLKYGCCDFHLFFTKFLLLTLFYFSPSAFLLLCPHLAQAQRCVRVIPILSQPPCLDPSISVALIPPPRAGFAQTELRCCPVISLLVPLHSHFPWRGAVSLLEGGLQCIMCILMIL